MHKPVSFSSNGSQYTATTNDIFMDNGAIVVFIERGRNANPTAPRVQISAKEWQRIKPQLTAVDYEQYYGRKPLLNGVAIYQVKQAK